MVEKNYFKQRIPGFIDPRGIVPVEFEFTETKELLEHPYIQRFLNYNPPSTVVKSGKYVMVVENEGFSWWVIGSVLNPDFFQVPEWNGGKYIVEYENGDVEVLTNESKNPVVSICGNEATLRDGTKCRKIKYEDWRK